MQDVIVIGIALVTGLWLARSLLRRFVAPPCRPPAAAPNGADGFVSLRSVTLSGQKKNRGDPKAAPIDL